MSSEKYYLSVEAVARVMTAVQEGIMLEHNITGDLLNVELEVQKVGDKNTLVLTKEYRDSLPQSAKKAIDEFLSLDDLN